MFNHRSRRPGGGSPADRSRQPALGMGVALLAAVMLAITSCVPCCRSKYRVPEPAEMPPPPATRVDNVVELIHGVQVTDPYRWLEDQEGPETRGWIDEQNEYADLVLGSLPGQAELHERFTELLKIDRLGFPIVREGRYFFPKRRADQELFVIYVREGYDGEDEVLLDPHPWSEDHTTSVGLMDISPDGRILVYGVRAGGEDETTVKLLDVDAREDLPDVLPRDVYFSVSITGDKTGLYYSRREEEGPRVYYHRMGSDFADDRLIFGVGYGPDKIIGTGISEDGRYLSILVYYGSAGEKTEVWVKDLLVDGEIFPIVRDIDSRFHPEFAGGLLLLETIWEAPNGRVLAVPMANPVREAWRELIPERDHAIIQSISAVGGRIFINYLENVQSRVVAFDTEGSELGEISFGTIGTVSNLGGLWESSEAFFVFTSFHVPTTIYRYDISSGEREIWSQTDAPVDTDIFEVKQVWFPSKDGTRVPMFLVHGKGLELDGDNPTIITGYGGFSVSFTPYFSSSATVWVENGGVFGIVNLRGGGEFGEEWHRAGMFERKQNVFDDFIAAGEWLVREGYTRPERLAIEGGSNGGLLVGAVMTQRPDLCKAVICTYPVLDMLRYHMFLMGPYWVSEYGSADDPEQFEYIYAYSPYHNLEAGIEYPAVFFITGDSDTRVTPMHARKMAALMQAETGSETPVLLRYHTKAGHMGGRPLSQIIDDQAESFGFLFWQLGMEM